MNVSRNAPCPCGSGLKHKNCCAGKTPWHKKPMVTAALLVLLLVGGVVLAGVMINRPDDAGTAVGSAAPGPAPPGKVWSAEHGHWHDAP